MTTGRELRFNQAVRQQIIRLGGSLLHSVHLTRRAHNTLKLLKKYFSFSLHQCKSAAPNKNKSISRKMDRRGKKWNLLKFLILIRGAEWSFGKGN